MPGSADYVLTHQHGGENVGSDNEPDEVAIMEEFAYDGGYWPEDYEDYYCYQPEDFE